MVLVLFIIKMENYLKANLKIILKMVKEHYTINKAK